jgi:adenylate kinase
MINIILFGPPGSGKGTQAVKIAEKYRLVHISTGDLFRYEMSNDTPLGLEAKAYVSRGELVPDAVTIGMLKNKMEMHPDANGFIFDGFPRTIPQAEALDQLMNEKGFVISCLLSLEVNEDEIVKRILSRGATSGRADDNDESIIRNRINVYRQETSPVYDYYQNRELANTIYGIGSIEDIYENLCSVIDSTQH